MEALLNLLPFIFMAIISWGWFFFGPDLGKFLRGHFSRLQHEKWLRLEKDGRDWVINRAGSQAEGDVYKRIFNLFDSLETEDYTLFVKILCRFMRVKGKSGVAIRIHELEKLVEQFENRVKLQ